MDTINKISGPLDANSFDNDEDALGTKVLAEVVQCINKINELVDGATAIDTDLAAEIATRTSEVAALTSQQSTNTSAISANAALIADNTTDIGDHESRVTLLESYQSIHGHLRLSASTDLTVAQCVANRLIECHNFVSNAVQYIKVPTGTYADDVQAMLPMTIVNNGVTGGVEVVFENYDIPPSKYLGDGTVLSTAKAKIVLAVSDWVTMLPMWDDDGADQQAMAWHIMGGKTYADVEAE